jgi:STE24 endopeptidase
MIAQAVVNTIWGLANLGWQARDGPMRDAVVELAQRTGTPDDKIFIYDGSKQSDRYTANVSGLFGSARVAMSDVMFAKGADLAEVRGVVGHEMGHYVHMHSLWMTGILILLAGLVFWLIDRLFPVAKGLLGANRVGDISDPAGLPVLAAIGAVIGLLLTPVTNTMIRVIEQDADQFSLIHANEPDGLAKALIKTAEYRAPSPSAGVRRMPPNCMASYPLTSFLLACTDAFLKAPDTLLSRTAGITT